ncbi:MotA/TolQ/ExbB proton channel family protein [Halodesulfovibrio sp.]|jgi:biopolymer transport protein ExbB|uniref:MotA/TolQ/ExbB proton channel family protein n=1 Tax=Halodesulfovibrio sp. TaxID=1912772 RepID=UPI0025F75285|nr:MotA/TolQ/ExbB proton channel family protein [Halodesulfovibrio sp.]MCT4535897.1 MotA/TolQ/ExbB proton channel family protein [Halodesulfovibrio sp.]MCT4626392.1 MotA/TolQ/ExbB proton channel family protein [Halodesulfovibrio sp.]
MTLLPQLTEQLHAGGTVLIPIIITGFVMWWLIINKFFILIQFKKNERSASELQTNPPPAWHWQSTLAATYKKLRSQNDETNNAIMATIGNSCCENMAKGLSTIALLVTAAPLMGLLGTVTGMITTFTTIAEFGTGNARGLAEGISQALITTQGGLLVAIPGYVAMDFLQRRVNRLRQRINAYLTYIDAELLSEPEVNTAQRTTAAHRSSTHV